MKRGIFVLALLFASINTLFAAEHILQGRVVDTASGSGVGYATVVLTSAEGKGVSAVAADKDGNFTLRYNKEGSYTLTFSSVGYATVEKSIEFGTENTTLDLGNVALQAGMAIESITVKPLVVEKADRLVYNVTADPEAKYRKMTAIVDKVPGLDQTGGRGTFQYNNMPIQKILINGKEELLISGGRQYTMEFIGAALMDEIKVIMPGSPEYGNDKIILNIKTNQPLPRWFCERGRWQCGCAKRKVRSRCGRGKQGWAHHHCHQICLFANPLPNVAQPFHIGILRSRGWRHPTLLTLR